MTNTLKIKLSKFFNIMFIIIIGALVGVAGYILIGSEIGLNSAIQIRDWLETNYGIAVSAGSITAILAIARMVLSIKNNNDKTVTAVNANVEQVQALKKDILKSNEETKTEINNTINEFKKAMVSMQAQPEKINRMEMFLNDIAEKQAINFNLLDLFMYKNTNDQEIKDICSQYKQSKLFQDSRSMEKFINNVPEMIDDIKEFSEKPFVKKAIKKITDTVPEIIQKVSK